jgi:hypothetical protein
MSHYHRNFIEVIEFHLLQRTEVNTKFIKD